MPVKIPEVKSYKTFSVQNLKQSFKPRHIVSAMASDGFLPVIALEAFVEAGRTFQAYNRGGFDEARERITEEFSGAVFWLGGVTGLNWLFDKLIGQRLFKMPKKTVDIASDNVRNPLKNFLNLEKFIGSGGEITQSFMAKYKFAKVISSVLIANTFIGFILPKINQAITRSYHKNDKKAQSEEFIKRPQMNDFAQKKDNKDVSFGGLNLLSLANNFENNRNWKLLSVDAGTCSGRVYSARNDDERVEIAFRDLSSIYFYMFNMPNMNKWLNMAEHGYATRLDPVGAKFATQYMENYVDTLPDKKVSVEQFCKEFLGENAELPEGLKSKFNNGTIKLADFKEELKNIVPPEKLAQIEETAEKMSQLQQERTEIRAAADGTHRILTEAQARDVLNGGHINNPEFLKAFYRTHFGDKKFLGEYRFIANEDIETLKKDLTNYVESVIARAKKTQNQEITKDLLKYASRHNFKMNAMNWGIGFAISAAFLSTFIPKLQYLITRLRTGENAFPGTEQFRN